MSERFDFTSHDFSRVMDYPDELYVFDLSDTYDPDLIASKGWGVGRYNELRRQMYLAPQYKGERNIHMGIDIWGPAGEAVYAFYDGEVVYMEDHDQKGNYGPTIVTRHMLNDKPLYALHGHLSRDSLGRVEIGQKVAGGEEFAAIGKEEENGGWVPHLHFQLSVDDPGEADMPGVVSSDRRKEALEKFPDPRFVLGPLY